MPVWFRRLLATLLVVVICMGIIPVQAEITQVETARNVIKLFPQHRYWVSYEDCNELCFIWLKRTEKISTMCTSGCMIWAFVHAIEWCQQEKYDNKAGQRVVEEFIAADPAPWDVLFVLDENYHNVVRAQGLEVLSAPPTTEEEVSEFFQTIGAVVCNMGGHCTVAIGYDYFDYDGDGVEDMMLHFVDSALWSSAKKQEIYDFRTGKLVAYTEDCAGEFWLPRATYVNLDRLAIVPVDAISGDVAETESETLE